MHATRLSRALLSRTAPTPSALVPTSASSPILRSTTATSPLHLQRAQQRRTYAEAVSDKIKLSLALPHQSIYKSQNVVQVNIPAESGVMGILAQHVPTIEQLKPGVVEVLEESGGTKSFFCGFFLDWCGGVPWGD